MKLYGICLSLTCFMLYNALQAFMSQMGRAHPFLWLYSICVCVCVCVCVPYLLYPFICGWTLDCYDIFAMVINAALNIEVHVSLQISVFMCFG